MTEQTIRSIAFLWIGAWLVKSLAVPVIEGIFQVIQAKIKNKR